MKHLNRSPYVWGALTGLLMVGSLLMAGKFFGASTTYARAAGYIGQAVDSSRVANNAYFAKYITQTPADIIINWQVLFVVGIMLGALVASLWNRDFQRTGLPSVRSQSQGQSILKRLLFGFIGGIIALFGVRLAGGCPSGHGLAGISQLSLSGFIALGVFFLTGVIVASIMYRKNSH